MALIVQYLEENLHHLTQYEKESPLISKYAILFFCESLKDFRLIVVLEKLRVIKEKTIRESANDVDDSEIQSHTSGDSGARDLRTIKLSIDVRTSSVRKYILTNTFRAAVLTRTSSLGR